MWIRLPRLLPRPAAQPTLHWTWWWVHWGFRVVGRMGRMGREIGRRTGAAAAVTGALNQSVVDKRELSRKGKISISRSVYVESLDHDWKNQAANTSSQCVFSPQGGRAEPVSHTSFCLLLKVRKVLGRVFSFPLFIAHHNTILKGAFRFEPSGQVLFFSSDVESTSEQFLNSRQFGNLYSVLPKHAGINMSIKCHVSMMCMLQHFQCSSL